MRYEVEGEVWATDGPGGWCFLTLPQDLTEGLRTVRGANTVAFGSMRVEVTLGGTTWRTSLFPDTRRGAFLLPLKADVRRRERIAPGDRVRVALEVLI